MAAKDLVFPGEYGLHQDASALRVRYKAALTRAGVNGAVRNRTPVASATALPTAAGTTAENVAGWRGPPSLSGFQCQTFPRKCGSSAKLFQGMSWAFCGISRAYNSRKHIFAFSKFLRLEPPKETRHPRGGSRQVQRFLVLTPINPTPMSLLSS